MIWLLALAFAGTADEEETAQVDHHRDRPLERLFRRADPPPPATYDGDFDTAPVFHWVVDLPGGILNSAAHTERGRPVLVDGSIFVGSAAGDALYELSRRNGGKIRSFPARSSVEAEPLVTDEYVFFSDTGGATWCYTRDGELVWEHDSKAPMLVRPTLDEGVIFVTNVDDLGVALDAATGELLWRYQAKADLTRESELTLYGAPPAVVADDIVVLGFADGSLTGLDKASGEVQWTKRVGEGRYPDIVAEPIHHGRDLYASGYFQPLVALDLETRNVRWRIDAGAAGAVVVQDNESAPDVLFHPGTDGVLRAVVTLTGADKWEWDSGTGSALTSPVVTEAGLFVGSTNGSLWLIDPKSGKEIWSFSEPYLLNGVTVAPAVDGRQAVFVSNAGRLYSLLSPQSGPKDRSHRFPFEDTHPGGAR